MTKAHNGEDVSTSAVLERHDHTETSTQTNDREFAEIARSIAWFVRLGEWTPFAGRDAIGDSSFDRTGYLILEHLSNGSAAGLSDLATRLCVHPSSISRELGKLESSGFVARQRSPQNHRVNLVEMTPEGSDALNAIRAARTSATRMCLDDWEPEEIEMFSSQLNRYIDRLVKLTGEGLMPKD